MVDVVILNQGFDNRADFGLSMNIQGRVGNTVLGNLELTAAGADQDPCLAAFIESAAVDLLGNLVDAGAHDLIQNIRRHVDEVDDNTVVRVEIFNGIGDCNGIIGGNHLLDLRCRRNHGYENNLLFVYISKKRAEK